MPFVAGGCIIEGKKDWLEPLISIGSCEALRFEGTPENRRRANPLLKSKGTLLQLEYFANAFDRHPALCLGVGEIEQLPVRPPSRLSAWYTAELES